MTPVRTVLVTGAAGGMCRGINARLAAAGHRLVLVDLAEPSLDSARHALGTEARVHTYAADLTDDDAVHDLVARVGLEVGHVDALVNAAGVLQRKALAQCTVQDFRNALEINLVAPYALIRAFGPGMVANGWGRIVNIASNAGLSGYPYPGYGAAKAALVNLSRGLVIDFRGTGVTVNTVNPGVVDTPLISQSAREAVARKVPTGALIEPDEIGALVAFLVSDDGRSVNGAALQIDGGATSFFRLIDSAEVAVATGVRV